MDRNISYQRSVRLLRRHLPDFSDRFVRGFLGTYRCVRKKSIWSASTP
jgi:hypothetical protein